MFHHFSWFFITMLHHLSWLNPYVYHVWWLNHAKSLFFLVASFPKFLHLALKGWTLKVTVIYPSRLESGWEMWDPTNMAVVHGENWWWKHDESFLGKPMFRQISRCWVWKWKKHIDSVEPEKLDFKSCFWPFLPSKVIQKNCGLVRPEILRVVHVWFLSPRLANQREQRSKFLLIDDLFGGFLK